MDLDDSSRYALGALFTLALHANELKTGAEANHNGKECWGQHDQQIKVVTEADPEEQQAKIASLWDAFWGYDLVHAEGLLDRVFTKLGIPNTSWPGLKVLPEVAREAGYQTLVQQYRTVLDPELRSFPAPKVSTEPPRPKLDAALQQLDTSSLAAAIEEDDEDISGDIQRVCLRQQPGRSARSEMEKGELISWDQPEEAYDEVEAEPSSGQTQARDRQEDDSIPASELAARTRREGDPRAAAFSAATELLEACVADLSQPQLGDIVKTDKETKSAAKVERHVEVRGAEKNANVRWYDSRAREALKAVATWLHVPWAKLQLYECLLAQQAQAPEVKGDGRKTETPKERRMRALKVGAAAAGGGALLAITGGLAAPALAAVAGSVLTTVGGSAAAAGAVTSVMGSTVGAAAIIGGFGAGGAHIVGGKMARRIGDVKEFGFRAIPDDQNYRSSYSANIPPADAAQAEPSPHPTEARLDNDPEAGASAASTGNSSSWFPTGSSSSGWLPWSSKSEPKSVPLLPIPVSAHSRADPKLCRTIAVAGWIAEPDDFVNLWRGLSSQESERFSLVWETKELVELNNSIMNMLLSQAYSAAGKYLIEKFVIHGLVGAVALPMTVLNVSGVIDSTWAVVMNRAARAGELLAHVLMSGAHGDSPITLVGNSMGARLIFYCLLELCRCKCKGVVEHAIMLGTPVDVIPERWVMARSVVSGRCVNGFSRKDWVLALSFRARQGTFRPAAGLGEVAVAGIENVDLTELVHGHGDYVKNMDLVLDNLDLLHPHEQQ